MSPSQLMIRGVHWVCRCCGEVARTARAPRECLVCGNANAAFEQQREVSLPSD